MSRRNISKSVLNYCIECICLIVFAVLLLQKHLRTVDCEQRELYRCNFCKAGANSLQGYEDHMAQYHAARVQEYKDKGLELPNPPDR